MKQKVSTTVQSEAKKLANGTKKPGQTREQTKLITAGIEKGIAEYKKLHKAKMRQQDKLKKQQAKVTDLDVNKIDENMPEDKPKTNVFPWILLIVSWVGFIAFYKLNF